LGLTEEAKKDVSAILTNKEPRMRFPGFWAAGHDYAPDGDNGGNGQNVLQLMLMQCEDKKIILLPAWPKDWDADFKLNAPFNTIVEGTVKNGKILNLVVTPSERMADIQLADGSKLSVAK
jgi:alpha-L-fucosidase 2